MTVEALGGKNPEILEWTLEIEPFSTFSYAVMRNNIFALCVDEKYLAMRNAIIYKLAPELPDKSEYDRLVVEFKEELSVLNEE